MFQKCKKIHKRKKYYFLFFTIILAVLLYANASRALETESNGHRDDNVVPSLASQENPKYIAHLKQLIQQGNTQALETLTELILRGNVDAFEVLKCVSEKNDDAKLFLATLFLYGNTTLGIESDFKKSFELFTDLEKKDPTNPEVQLSLGFLYSNGAQAQQNFQKAAYYFQKAANNNSDLYFKARAMYELAELYATGSGVEVNIEKAIDLCKSMLNLADHIDDDAHGSSSSALPHQTSENLKLERLEKLDCMVLLGSLYLQKNDRTSAEQYLVPASKEHPGAAALLGCMYFNSNIQKTVELFKFSASKNDAKGLYGLGYCYLKGLGVEKDIAKAKDLWEASAKQGNKYAMEGLKSHFGHPPTISPQFNKLLKAYKQLFPNLFPY